MVAGEAGVNDIFETGASVCTSGRSEASGRAG